LPSYSEGSSKIDRETHRASERRRRRHTINHKQRAAEGGELLIADDQFQVDSYDVARTYYMVFTVAKIGLDLIRVQAKVVGGPSGIGYQHTGGQDHPPREVGLILAGQFVSITTGGRRRRSRRQLVFSTRAAIPIVIGEGGAGRRGGGGAAVGEGGGEGLHDHSTLIILTTTIRAGDSSGRYRAGITAAAITFASLAGHGS